MEVTAGFICVLGFIALLVFFKRSIKRVADHVDDVVATNINESQADLIERSAEAYKEIVERCGENYLTPSEMYSKIQHRRRRIIQR